ncbi:MAG: toxin-antitoxin system YwqK family antitoxin [Flavobacteriales bacterium]|nr:toxin-antitoxin system YwqK family antitoxin [Flavobacteriales bacterium]
MRLRSLFLLTVLSLAAITSAQPPAAPNVTDAQGRKQGPWAKSWPNGGVRYQGQFKDDKPVGEFKHFDEEGRLSTVQRHAGDGRVSRAEHFHADGGLMAAGKYVGQAKDSTWNFYGTDGKLRKVERYANGALNGEQLTYYPSGQVAESEMRVNGQQQGPYKSWFPNGKPKSEATYLHGEPEGRMTFWFPDGKKEIEGNAVNGDRDGTWYYFNPDGTLQLQALYSKGELVKERFENGKFTEYYDDEQVKSEVTYKKGKRDGPFTEWYDNGRWVMKPMQPDPERGTPGEVERVLEGQKKRREGTYVNAMLEGEVKEYDEQGKLVKTTRYAGGEEQ